MKGIMVCRIGCAGWSLPKELRDPERSYLERYASLFNCVEINSSFYRHHKPETYARWASLVSDGFLFSVKVPKSISHETDLPLSTLERFLDEISGLGERLGPLLIQFPPALSFDRTAARYLFSEFRRRFDGAIVCEPRHATWFTPPASDLLREFSISPVGADPRPTSAAPEVFSAQSFRYYRLHGSPRKYFSSYTTEFLEKLHGLDSLQARTAWVIFDNTAHGYAQKNALELSEMYQEKDLPRHANASVHQPG